MSLSTILSTATRATLQAATDAVTNHPFTCTVAVVGAAATGVYFYTKKKMKEEEAVESVARFEEVKKRDRLFVEKPYVHKPKPEAAAPKAEPQPEPEVKPQANPEPAQEAPKQEEAQQPQPDEATQKPQQDESETVFHEENLYTMDPHEMLKKPKIQKIVQAFEEAHNKDFPADLAKACEDLTMQAHMRMADLVNTSRSFHTEKMRQDDLLLLARSTAANARMSMRFTNRIHSTRTFRAEDKASAKLLLALLATAVKRDHNEHMGTEAQGMTEAIALLDECYARGVHAVYFYETVVFDAPEERERQVIEHQVRVMVDMIGSTFAQSVVF